MMAPIFAIGIGLLVAEILHRRDPERFRRELAEEEARAEKELDEILSP